MVVVVVVVVVIVVVVVWRRGYVQLVGLVAVQPQEFPPVFPPISKASKMLVQEVNVRIALVICFIFGYQMTRAFSRKRERANKICKRGAVLSIAKDMYFTINVLLPLCILCLLFISEKARFNCWR